MATNTDKLIHNYNYTSVRGQTHIKCRCGVNSPWFLDATENHLLVEWANAHTIEHLGIERGKHAGKVVIRA